MNRAAFLEELPSGPVFTVTDLKQYRYCPRIIYFTYVQPVPRLTTASMDLGAEMHQRLEKLEPRRTVKRYGLEEAEKLFRVKFRSPLLGLSGQLDLLLLTERAAYPVEFKSSRRVPGPNHRIQLAAYALLAEEEFEVTVETGFFLLYPPNRLVPIPIGPAEKEAVRQAVGEMREMVLRERWPERPAGGQKCILCEWKKFCNDVR